MAVGRQASSLFGVGASSAAERAAAWLIAKYEEVTSDDFELPPLPERRRRRPWGSDDEDGVEWLEGVDES